MKCFFTCLSLLLFTGCVASAADWPTIHANPARTGYASDALAAGAKMLWRRSIENAPIATCVEPVAAVGLVFVPSMNGTLYALKQDDGAIAWSFPTGGPILHSPAFADSKLYTGSIDGRLYCLDAATGKLIWSFDSSADGRGGFATSPCVDAGVTYIGSRNGNFYAIKDAGQSPTLLWKVAAGGPIWQTAAVANGRVYFMAEDMIARCLDSTTGKEIWKSRQVDGYRARDYYPCVFGDWVVFPTSPATGAENVTDGGNRTLGSVAGLGTIDSDDKAKKIRAMASSPEAPALIDKEQAAVSNFLDQHPEQRTLYCFNAADGREVKIPSIWGGGCGGVMSPPTALADGTVIALWRGFYTGWTGETRWDYASPSPHRGLGVLDLAQGKFQRWPPASDKLPWGLFFRISDETSVLQAGGSSLYAIHQSEIAAVDTKTRAVGIVFQNRDNWAGGPCLSWAANEWNGPSRGGLAIANGRAFWISGSYIAGFGGK